MLLINKSPYLQMSEPDSIIVMWETSIDASSTVALYSTEKLHYGLNGNYKSIGEPVIFKNANENRRIHFV